MLALRSFFVAILVLPFVKFPRNDLKALLGFALISYVGASGLNYSAMKLIDASMVVLINKLQIPVAVILGSLFLGEVITKRKTIGMCILLLSACFFLLGQPESPSQLGGVLFSLGSCFFFAGAMFVSKKLSHLSPMTLVGYSSALSLPFTFTLSCLFEKSPMTQLAAMDMPAIISVIFLVIFICIIGYSMWYWFLHKYELGQVAPLLFLDVVFGVLTSAIFLNEAFTLEMLMGAVFIFFGVITLQMKGLWHKLFPKKIIIFA